MKQQKLIDLINASQATIKTQLLPEATKHKYELLMLIRSFELLKSYILQKDAYLSESRDVLQDQLQMPVADLDEALQALSSDIRLGKVDNNIMPVLQALNQAEFSLTEPKAKKNA